RERQEESAAPITPSPAAETSSSPDIGIGISTGPKEEVQQKKPLSPLQIPDVEEPLPYEDLGSVRIYPSGRRPHYARPLAMSAATEFYRELNKRAAMMRRTKHR